MTRLMPRPLQDIKITDPLFSHYIGKLHSEIIPYQWNILNDGGAPGTPENRSREEVSKMLSEKTSHQLEGSDAIEDTPVASGCLRNFRIAAGLEEGERYGVIFQDSDLAKWLEAVAYSLQTHPDPELEQRADDCIALIEQAQCEDGYLNTYFTLTEPGKRWTNLMEGHELYCAGHLMEAAVAYAEATGKRRFLSVMCRYADLIDQVFGPEEGKLKGYPGHEEIELALVKLYHATGEKRYLDLALYFINQRGQKPLYFVQELAARGGKTHYNGDFMMDPTYAQIHKPPREQTTAEGHAVRATYLYCAMADLALEYQDEELWQACRKIFDNIRNQKLYITGGIGSVEKGERFSGNYDLPNDTCYCETCASIGLALFALRMCRMERDAAYADVMENALYNRVLAGVNRDGNRFFYVSPLEITPDFCDHSASLAHVTPERQQWFDVACCPTNIARTLGSLGQYLLSTDGEETYVYLYLSAETALGNGDTLSLQTDYPISGKVRLQLRSGKARKLWLRIPGHSPLNSLRINGVETQPEIRKGFAEVCCAAGETQIDLVLQVRPRFVYAKGAVSTDAGKTALTQGPLVYCFEQADNGAGLGSLIVDPSQTPQACECPVDAASNALLVQGWRETDASDTLYGTEAPAMEKTVLKAVPYYCWNNRGRGEMRVWMRYKR
ncbi:MAG: glycoside hydrolase family 127 protein [Eubacteriales bacterium]|nr:glycoside hydrolase family 127 protein [Eubacteriales bacterium]